MDYLNHWRLQDRPFESNRNVAYFYPGREHVEALERLLYLVRDGNMCFGLLTGEIGAGKTMVLHQFCHRLRDEPRFTVVHIPNGGLEFTDLLREVLRHLESRGPGRYWRRPRLNEGKYELLTRLTEIVENKIARLGRSLVLVIDEAQDLAESALVELRNLTNMGSRHENYVTIILAGQPELGAVVRALPQIDQRVGLRYHLPCLDQDAVADYLVHRLRAAGADDGALFDADATTEVYDQTQGVPREINRLCKLALDRSFSLGQRQVSATVVRSIAADIYHQDAQS